MAFKNYKKSLLTVVLSGLLLSSTAPVQAGWFDWLWGKRQHSGQSTCSRFFTWAAIGASAVAATMAGWLGYKWYQQHKAEQQHEVSLAQQRKQKRLDEQREREFQEQERRKRQAQAERDAQEEREHREREERAEREARAKKERQEREASLAQQRKQKELDAQRERERQQAGHQNPSAQPRSQSASPRANVDHKRQAAASLIHSKSASSLDALRHHADAMELYNKGRGVLRYLLNEQDGSYDQVMSYDDIRALIWFLYIYAGLKDQSNAFEEGSFILHGKGNQIKKIFSNLEHILESRMSSHLKQYGATSYGMDIANLPAEKQTLLIIKPTDAQLFIKPENYGVKGVVNTLCHGYEWVVAQLRKIQPVRDALGMQADDGAGWRKERIPADVLKEAIGLLYQLKGKGLEEAEIPVYQNLFGQFGIQKIVSFFERYADQDDAIKTFVEKLKQGYPDWQKRIGNEVILEIDELLAAPVLGMAPIQERYADAAQAAPAEQLPVAQPVQNNQERLAQIEEEANRSSSPLAYVASLFGWQQ